MYSNIYIIIIIIIIHQQTALNASNTTESVSMSVISYSEVFDSAANPNKEIFVDNFRFTKAEDILFALEMNGEFVYNLLYRKIYEKPNAKANEDTALLEVLAAVILKCYNKDAIEELYLVNLLHFDDPDVGLWKGVKNDWALALHEALPKNLEAYMRLQQNELFFDNNSYPVGIESFNFIRDIQWNNMEKEIDAIPESVFRFWDQKDVKKRLFICMERHLFFTNSIHKFQSIIHLMTAMIQIRCKMARIKNEKEASNELNFRIQTTSGEIRNPTTKEEFVQVIKEFKIPVEKVFIDSITEEFFSKTSKMARVQSYLTIMYKYAGKEIDIMIGHFTNTAVYAFIIEDLIVTTVSKLNWNQNVILFLNRGATAIMHMEIWKRFLMARDELFRKAENETLNTADEAFKEAVYTVRELINENNVSLSFFSELEKSITKKASGQEEQQQHIATQKKSTKRKFKVPFARRSEEEKIPSEKESFSVAKMVNTMEKKNTTLEKTVGVEDDKKLHADNIIPQHNIIIKKPSPVKEYRYNEFERSGRISRNRARDLKGIQYFFKT